MFPFPAGRGVVLSNVHTSTYTSQNTSQKRTYKAPEKPTPPLSLLPILLFNLTLQGGLMHFDFVLSKSESPEHVKFGSMFLPPQPVMVGKALTIKAS
jgi:hypothetical protein